MQHFLVTGGAGFIGAQVTTRLLAAGHAVTVLDDLSSGSKSRVAAHRNLLWIERHLLYTGAEEMPAQLDGIVHLAARVGETGLDREAMHQHHTNLSATLRVLMLAKERKIPKVVFASSSLLDLPQPPDVPYLLQKRASEEYGHFFGPGGSGFVTVRLPLITGEGMRDWPIYRQYQAETGSLDVQEAVTKLVAALMRGD